MMNIQISTAPIDYMPFNACLKRVMERALLLGNSQFTIKKIMNTIGPMPSDAIATVKVNSDGMLSLHPGEFLERILWSLRAGDSQLVVHKDSPRTPRELLKIERITGRTDTPPMVSANVFYVGWGTDRCFEYYTSYLISELPNEFLSLDDLERCGIVIDGSDGSTVAGE